MTKRDAAKSVRDIRRATRLKLLAASFEEWLRRVGIQPIRFDPQLRCENGCNERFIGKYHRQVLNAQRFVTT